MVRPRRNGSNGSTLRPPLKIRVPRRGSTHLTQSAVTTGESSTNASASGTYVPPRRRSTRHAPEDSIMISSNEFIEAQSAQRPSNLASNQGSSSVAENSHAIHEAGGIDDDDEVVYLKTIPRARDERGWVKLPVSSASRRRLPKPARHDASISSNADIQGGGRAQAEIQQPEESLPQRERRRSIIDLGSPCPEDGGEIEVNPNDRAVSPAGSLHSAPMTISSESSSGSDDESNAQCPETLEEVGQSQHTKLELKGGTQDPTQPMVISSGSSSDNTTSDDDVPIRPGRRIRRAPPQATPEGAEDQLEASVSEYEPSPSHEVTYADSERSYRDTADDEASPSPMDIDMNIDSRDASSAEPPSPASTRSNIVVQVPSRYLRSPSLPSRNMSGTRSVTGQLKTLDVTRDGNRHPRPTLRCDPPLGPLSRSLSDGDSLLQVDDIAETLSQGKFRVDPTVIAYRDSSEMTEADLLTSVCTYEPTLRKLLSQLQSKLDEWSRFENPELSYEVEITDHTQVRLNEVLYKDSFQVAYRGTVRQPIPKSSMSMTLSLDQVTQSMWGLELDIADEDIPRAQALFEKVQTSLEDASQDINVGGPAASRLRDSDSTFLPRLASVCNDENTAKFVFSHLWLDARIHSCTNPRLQHRIDLTSFAKPREVQGTVTEYQIGLTVRGLVGEEGEERMCGVTNGAESVRLEFTYVDEGER